MRKILFTVLIALIIITLGELGYYFYYQSYLISTQLSNQNGNREIVGLNNRGLSELNDTSVSNTNPSPTPKLYEYQERDLMMKENVLVSSSLIDQFNSTIEAIDKTPNVRDGFSYNLRIALVVGKGSVDFLLNQYGINKIKVFDNVNGQLLPSSLDNLKPGDRIIIDRILDGTKPIGFNVVKFNITRL